MAQGGGEGGNFGYVKTGEIECGKLKKYWLVQKVIRWEHGSQFRFLISKSNSHFNLSF